MKSNEEYQKKKQEYYHNRKPERYILHDTGIGFIVQDTLAHKNNRTKESDYHLIPEMNRYNKDTDYKSAQDLIDELNELDYQVNGNLYDDDKYWVMNIKERLYSELKLRLNDSLNHFTGYDKFKFSVAHLCNFNRVEEIEINVTIKDASHDLEPPKDNTHPIFDAIINHKSFEIINEYLDEVENSQSHDDMIRTDTLIELKMRLLAGFQGGDCDGE